MKRTSVFFLAVLLLIADIAWGQSGNTALSGTYYVLSRQRLGDRVDLVINRAFSITFTGSNFTGLWEGNSMSGTFSVSRQKLTLNITGGIKKQKWNWTIRDANTLVDHDSSTWNKQGTTTVEKKEKEETEVTLQVLRGSFYAYQFELYKNPSNSTQSGSLYFSGGKYFGRTYGDKAPKMSNDAPSEQDIDRTISAYEDALKKWPGDLSFLADSFNINGVDVDVSVRKRDVEALLAEAKRRKEQWPAEKQQREQQEAQRLAAEAQQLVDEAPNSTPNSQEDFEVAQNKEGGVTITNYKGTRKHVVIPGTLYGLKVTMIGEGAFSKKGLLSVVIPNTVTAIGGDGANAIMSISSDNSGVFRGNPLAKVTIPNSVITIGQDAFRDCQLTEVTIPNSVTTIGENAFQNSGLTSVTLGTGIRQIGGDAFRGNKLATLSIPNGVTLIGYNAFAGNPLATLVIPASLAAWEGKRETALGFSAMVATRGFRDDAFGNTSSLTRVTLPANTHDNNLENLGSDLRNYYISQNKAAGTYVKNGPVWVRQ